MKFFIHLGFYVLFAVLFYLILRTGYKIELIENPSLTFKDHVTTSLISCFAALVGGASAYGLIFLIHRLYNNFFK